MKKDEEKDGEENVRKDEDGEQAEAAAVPCTLVAQERDMDQTAERFKSMNI